MTRDVITFYDNIEQETVDELIKKVSESEKESVEIYFASGGGNIDQMYKLLDFFERTYDRGKVHFIFNFIISSYAFEFAVKVKAHSKTVLRSTMSRIHAYSVSFDYRDDLLKNGDTCPHLKYTRDINSGLQDFLYTCGMDEDNITTITKGEDVIIFEDRIRKCIDTYATKEEVQS